MYTCRAIGIDIQNKIQSGQSVTDIFAWLYGLYYFEPQDLSEDLKNFLEAFINKDSQATESKDYNLLNELSEILIQNKFDELEQDSLEYLKIQFGRFLKEKIASKMDLSLIGRFAYNYSFDHMENLDKEFEEILSAIAIMEAGPEFELNYEKLNEIADNLIAGKKVVL